MLCLVENIDQSDRAISTGVAHFLHTEGVTGSNPVSPIIKKYWETWPGSVYTPRHRSGVQVLSPDSLEISN